MTTLPEAFGERMAAWTSWLLSQASNRSHRILAERLAAEGLRGQHYLVLLALSYVDGAGAPAQAELSRLLGIDRSDMVALLNDLERRGYVARSRCLTDRRRNGVTMTADGRAARTRLDRLVDDANQAVLAPLTAGERAQLRGFLVRLARPD